MNRQRRSSPWIALRRSRAACRSRAVLLSLSVALLAILPAGCRNKMEEAREREALTKALDQFKTEIGELQKQASGLRVRFDKLPEDLPGMAPLRDDVHAIEEVLGVEGGRAKWLSARLDKAFASGGKQEIEAIRGAIPSGNSGIEQVIVRVSHQLLSIERMAAQHRFFDALDAARQPDAPEKGSPKVGGK